jgi:hypothetical protein
MKTNQRGKQTERRRKERRRKRIRTYWF